MHFHKINFNSMNVMSCHAQIVKRKALLWGGAAFLLSLSDGAAVPNSFWVVLTSPSFLGVALPCSSSPFGVVLLSKFLLLGGAAFPLPPLGCC